MNTKNEITVKVYLGSLCKSCKLPFEKLILIKSPQHISTHKTYQLIMYVIG